MDLEVFVHQRFEVVRGNTADDDDLGRVGKEVDGIMPREELRIARQDRALRRILEVRFERHHARLLHLLEDEVQQRQQIDVVRFREAGAHDRFDLRDDRLQHGSRRADDETADRRTTNDDELGRLVQDEQVAAGHEIATDDRAENDDEADDYEHSSLSEARNHARTMSGSK